MKYCYIGATLIVCLFLTGAGCNEDEGLILPSNLPSCLNELVRVGLYDELYERRVDGELSYLLQAVGCCDRGSLWVEEDCTRICSLGGFTGQGDGQCPDVSDAVVEDTLVWERE